MRMLSKRHNHFRHNAWGSMFLIKKKNKKKNPLHVSTFDFRQTSDFSIKANNLAQVKLLTHLLPMFPFSTSWKHQKRCIGNEWVKDNTLLSEIFKYKQCSTTEHALLQSWIR